VKLTAKKIKLLMVMRCVGSRYKALPVKFFTFCRIAKAIVGTMKENTFSSVQDSVTITRSFY